MANKLSVDTNPKISPLLPIAGVPDSLIQALNARFREIRNSPANTPSSAAAGAAGPNWRTLLIRNTAVGNDIADHLTCMGPSANHTVTLVRGVLRKTITADLSVRINSTTAGVTSVVGIFTIPATTPTDTPVDYTSGFTTSSLPDASSFSWDITASDGSTDPAGIASFTIIWTP